MAKRYQECSFLVRMWRKRHYIRFPFVFFKYFISLEKEDKYLAGRLAISEVHYRMHWYYTWDEVQKTILSEIDKPSSS